jgi:hypothetical protein
MNKGIYFLAAGVVCVATATACGSSKKGGAAATPDGGNDASVSNGGHATGGTGGHGGTAGRGGTGAGGTHPMGGMDAGIMGGSGGASMMDAGIDSGMGGSGGMPNIGDSGLDSGMDASDGATPRSCGILTPCGNVFTADNSTLAIFELNGDYTDSSGNGRDAIPSYDPTVDSAIPSVDPARFATTEWGKGLKLDGSAFEGFDWSQYASLLTEPFTIEMVMVPTETNCYQRLFAFERDNDVGWYLCDGFMAYPENSLPAAGSDASAQDFPIGERLYLAFVVQTTASADASAGSVMDVYVNGQLLGTTHSQFLTPPTDAVFFEDDNHSSENADGVVDAVRVSSGNRSAGEIAATWALLQTQPLGSASDAGDGG